MNRPTTFASSDLPRAMESARIIGKHIGMDPTPDPAIRDWNTGRLAGKKFSAVKDIIFDLIDHPDKPAPGGESLNSYLNRFVPAMRKRAADTSTHLVVGHARGATILRASHRTRVAGVARSTPPSSNNALTWGRVKFSSTPLTGISASFGIT